MRMEKGPHQRSSHMPLVREQSACKLKACTLGPSLKHHPRRVPPRGPFYCWGLVAGRCCAVCGGALRAWLWLL